jgi:hypothetical protein
MTQNDSFSGGKLDSLPPRHSNNRKDDKEMTAFSPYQLACELGYTEMQCGINWTWVTFADETTRQKFDAECRANGYRVRDYGECKTQYHHYAD